MPALEELDMEFCKGNSDWLVHLKGCEQLKLLRMGQQTVGKKAVAAIAGFKKLKDLAFVSSATDDSELQTLGRLTELERLCYFGNDKIIRLSFIKSLSKLEDLQLNVPNLEDQATTALEGCAKLRRLILANSPKLTDHCMAPIGKLKHLRELSIGGSEMTDRALEHLQGLAEMRELRIGGSGVTDDGLVYLQRMKHLRLLWVGGEITDEGLPHLARFHSLENLQLFTTQVTDAGLPALYGLKKLQLFSGGKMVTEEGAAKLLKEVAKRP
jgi:hypothetical protein